VATSIKHAGEAAGVGFTGGKIRDFTRDFKFRNFSGAGGKKPAENVGKRKGDSMYASRDFFQLQTAPFANCSAAIIFETRIFLPAPRHNEETGGTVGRCDNGGRYEEISSPPPHRHPRRALPASHAGNPLDLPFPW